jgi:heme-degrading monooxygenase HmoA
MAAIRLINCFEVPPGRDEQFLSRWQEINAHMAAKPGYLGHRLHRSLSPDARFRFVNYVEWESPAHLSAARDERFGVLRAAFESLGFTSTHAMYEVVFEREQRDEPAATTPSS